MGCDKHCDRSKPEGYSALWGRSSCRIGCIAIGICLQGVVFFRPVGMGRMGFDALQSSAHPMVLYGRIPFVGARHAVPARVDRILLGTACRAPTGGCKVRCAAGSIRPFTSNPLESVEFLALNFKLSTLNYPFSNPTNAINQLRSPSAPPYRLYLADLCRLQRPSPQQYCN